MKVWGGLIIAIGVIWFFIAFNMDTTVAVRYGEISAFGIDTSGYPDRVQNIYLAAEKQNHMFASAFATLIGLILFFMGYRAEEKVENQKKCPKCGQLISLEAVQCGYCQYVFSNEKFTNKAKALEIGFQDIYQVSPTTYELNGVEEKAWSTIKAEIENEVKDKNYTINNVGNTIVYKNNNTQEMITLQYSRGRDIISVSLDNIATLKTLEALFESGHDIKAKMEDLNSSTVDKLIQLKSMLDAGLLSEDEFRQQKDKLLAD